MVRAFTLLVVSALLLSCGSAAKCNTTSCIGCCDANDTCQAGTLEATCGKGGTLCIACPTDQLCTANACMKKIVCGPDNCSGCCDSNGACELGNIVSVCGNSGGACSACGAGKKCSLGNCVCDGSDTGSTCTQDSACCTGHCDGIGVTPGTCRAP